MGKKFDVPRGMKDIYPEEMQVRKWIFGKIRKIVDSHGFLEVEPTVIENFETLAAKSGEEIEKEIYVFEDKGGRKLGLRFDLTVGIARMVANKVYPKPLKWYSISNMFRYDAPQKGRYRCFWQWDVEIIGSKSFLSDLECLIISSKVMNSFDLDFLVKINSRKIVDTILNKFGIKNKVDFLRSLDKLQKIGKKGVLEEIKIKNIDVSKANEILEILDCKYDEIKEIVKNDKECLEEIERIDRILDYFEYFKKEEKMKNIECEFDFSIVRGLDYYTGIVFEGFVPSSSLFSAILGGGRYDNLLEIYSGGEKTPCVGFAGGIERLIVVLQELNKIPKDIEKPKIDYFVCFVSRDKECIDAGLKIAEKIRELGKSCFLDVSEKNLGNQMKFANKINARKVVIIGKKDIEKGKITIKDMESGEEKIYTLEEMQI